MGRVVVGVGSILVVISGVGCSRGPLPDPEATTTVRGAVTESFSVTVPQGITLPNAFISTTNRLQVDDRVTLGAASELEAVSNFGTGGLELGSAGLAHANVYNAAGPTFLRSRASVRGFVRAAGAIQTQEPVFVTGGRFPNTPTAGATTTWSVEWPNTHQGTVFVGPDQTRTLSPGAYGDFNVHSRARVFLSSGTYFFESFNTEPQAQIFLNKTAGSIFIYVRNSFRYHGAFAENGGAVGNVLVGFRGTQTVQLEAGFVGTMVAPNAKIDVRRAAVGQHRGAFFGREVEVFSDGTVLHVPFDWSFLCPLGDSDGDGINDCNDGCNGDPLKGQPGVCGCGNPDIDSDSDGLLNCVDCSPFDPSNEGCDDDELPPPVPQPDPPGDPVTPILGPTCTPDSALGTPPTSGNDHPTPTELNAMIIAPTVGNTACEAITVAADCPPDPNNVTDTACLADADCAGFGPQFFCRHGLPTSCVTNPQTPIADICHSKTRRCALLDPACLADPPPSCTGGACTVCDTNPAQCPCLLNPAMCGCVQAPVCPQTDAVGTAAPTEPYVTQPVPISQVIQDNRQPPPPGQYNDPVSGGCQAPFLGNCWCWLTMDEPPHLPQTTGTPHHHGGGSLLDLAFDPNVHFDVDVLPRPFGESSFTLDAGASFLATATVNLFGSHSTTIVDINAGVHGDRCNFSTNDTRFKVLGIDFIDLFGNEPFNTGDVDNPAFTAASECSSAVGQFQDAANRAKKAMKDAQLLLQRHAALPPGQTFNKTAFCNELEAQDDPGFPPGNCATDPVAATINRYVSYYDDRVQNLRNAMQNLALKTHAATQAFAQFGGTINFLDIPDNADQRNESATLLNVFFFVGPIPVSITVDVEMNYGVRGDLHYQFSPANGLGLTPGTTTQLAAASGKLVPSLGASLSLFIGAGFDVPGFAIKAGIEGRLTLAVITANLEAGTGLSMRAAPDLRAIPSDLAPFSTGEILFPTRQYDFFLDWYYGASLALTNVLEGTINAKLKLKALFFSKTFKKTLLHFPSPFNLPELRLIEGGNQIGGGVARPVSGLATNSLGTFEMQTPLVRLRPLTVTLPEPPAVAPFDLAENQKMTFQGFCTQSPPR
jgi:hypothetical protein